MTEGLTGVLIGSILLGIIHVLIPVHWLPIITIGKAEKWTDAQVVFAASVISFFHIFSTILIGICVGFLGYKLSVLYKVYSKIFASIILMLIGLYYLCDELIHKLDHKYPFLHGHHHHHHKIYDDHGSVLNKNFKGLVTSLSAASFLTPCIELEVYYFGAGLYGWKGIFLVSLIYMVITIILTVFLVYFGLKGLNNLKFTLIEKYKHQIIGTIMLLIGITIYLID